MYFYIYNHKIFSRKYLKIPKKFDQIEREWPILMNINKALQIFMFSRNVYEITRTAITEDCKLCSLKTELFFLSVLQASSPRSRCGRVGFSEGHEQRARSRPFRWLGDDRLLSVPSGIPSLCPVPIAFSCKSPVAWDKDTPQWPRFNAITSVKTASKFNHIPRC